jgi:hypothetical protein
MIGNDAHYTLAAFKHMCTGKRKELPAVGGKPDRFTIRDVQPEDFIVKLLKEKPPPRPKPPVEVHVGEAAVELISLAEDDDEGYMELCDPPEGQTPDSKSKNSKGKVQRPPSRTPSESSITPYDGATSETGSQSSRMESAGSVIAEPDPQLATSVWKPIRYFRNDLVPLATDTLVVIPKANGKKRSNRRDTTGRAQRPTIETDLSKYGNLIDDLTDVFGQLPQMTAGLQTSDGGEPLIELGIATGSSS